MGLKVTVDASKVPSILADIARKKQQALAAAGTEAVGLTVAKMQSGYGRPIWQTGDLQRDVQFHQKDENTVEVGNTLEYALFVHYGTSKMAGRPYLRDSIEDGRKRLEQIMAETMKG